MTFEEFKKSCNVINESSRVYTYRTIDEESRVFYVSEHVEQIENNERFSCACEDEDFRYLFTSNNLESIEKSIFCLCNDLTDDYDDDLSRSDKSFKMSQRAFEDRFSHMNENQHNREF